MSDFDFDNDLEELHFFELVRNGDYYDLELDLDLTDLTDLESFFEIHKDDDFYDFIRKYEKEYPNIIKKNFEVLNPILEKSSLENIENVFRKYDEFIKSEKPIVFSEMDEVQDYLKETELNPENYDERDYDESLEKLSELQIAVTEIKWISDMKDYIQQYLIKKKFLRLIHDKQENDEVENVPTDMWREIYSYTKNVPMCPYY